ncbi:Homeodomain-like protein, partial [Flagelloscypha sp. PMI_526]
MNRARWTAQEDELLLEALDLLGCPKNIDEDGDWRAIAALVPGRTNKQVRKRWLHSLNPEVRKSIWTPTEDAKLRELYKVHGPKWSLIAQGMPGRTDDSCSKRWRDALDPTVKRDVWDAAEDARLLELHGSLGPKWRDIGTDMNRSSLHCRNRFRLLERRQQRAKESAKSASPP